MTMKWSCDLDLGHTDLLHKSDPFSYYGDIKKNLAKDEEVMRRKQIIPLTLIFDLEHTYTFLEYI